MTDICSSFDTLKTSPTMSGTAPTAQKCYLTTSLPPAIAGIPVLALGVTDSTNAEAWRRVDAGELPPSGLAIVADSQTAGRGQHGHAWHSPPGLGLYLTFAWRPSPPLPLADSATLPPRAAQLLLDALDSLGCRPKTATIKPPNDILVDGRKLCGILIETRLAPAAPNDVETIVAGFGLNLRHALSDFPLSLRPLATSISLLGLPPPPIPALLEALLPRLRNDPQAVV